MGVSGKSNVWDDKDNQHSTQTYDSITLNVEERCRYRNGVGRRACGRGYVFLWDFGLLKVEGCIRMWWTSEVIMGVRMCFSPPGGPCPPIYPASPVACVSHPHTLPNTTPLIHTEMTEKDKEREREKGRSIALLVAIDQRSGRTP